MADAGDAGPAPGPADVTAAEATAGSPELFPADARDDWEHFPDAAPPKTRSKRRGRRPAGRSDTEGESGDDLPHGDPPTRRARGRRAAPLAAGPVAVEAREEPVPAPETGNDIETVGGETSEDLEPRRSSRPLRNYKIQEVIKRRQIMLVQVTKEERGNKGAALTTYLSLAGRYCVLMPNTARGGGVSRKIANPKDRKRMKAILEDLRVPEGMAVILRTAGLERTKAEIRRDFEYLLRLWDSIREFTLASTAPCVIHEEANLIKRAIRDLYSKDIDEVLVAGDEGYRTAKDFMKMLMPSHAKKVQHYRDSVPLFYRYRVETQIDELHSPILTLRSGGYIVINPTEALVAIDVNSGKSTRERNIEETAYKTNLEAADEIARQLRLRDLAGLIVIDFIDMEDDRHNAAVERRLKDAMKVDRARIQLGRISPFGLLELSRQRLRPSFAETHFQMCPHCQGLGLVRTMGSAALHVLRAIEEEGLSQRASEITVYVPADIALYIFNTKRETLREIEDRYGFRVNLDRDEALLSPNYRLELTRERSEDDVQEAPIDTARLMAETEAAIAAEDKDTPAAESGNGEDKGARKPKRGRRASARRKQEFEEGEEIPFDAPDDALAAGADAETEAGANDEGEESGDGDSDDKPRKKRRRGKRGGRRRAAQKGENGEAAAGEDGAETAEPGEPAEDAGETDAGEPVPAPMPGAGDLPAAPLAAAGDAGAATGVAPARDPAEPGIAAESGIPAPVGEEPAEPFTVMTAGSGESAMLPPWEAPDSRAETEAPEEPGETQPQSPEIAALAATDAATDATTEMTPDAPEAQSVAPDSPEALSDTRPPEPDLAEPAAEPHEHAAEEQPGEPHGDGETAPPGPAPTPDYERVNEPPERPRRGWWQRLIDG
ncbi:MAG: Rne/Rng family ribonuclease [Alphaproteobacteria bacterium]|nr:Rne/Rng family ribonuclease [Alphaproteobacteria bacterium]